MATIENLTIMFTDIVGFSKMVSSLTRRESEKLLRHHDKLLKRVVLRFNGQIIKSVGDSFLVTFRSPTDAVLCAMAMHDSLWGYNKDREDNKKIVIRVALNTGEVRVTHNDVFGEAVNIASRLEKETPGGSIYLTEMVYLSMNRNEVEFEIIGDHNFKGIPHPVKVYRAVDRKQFEASTTYDESYPFGGAHQNLKPQDQKSLGIGKVFVGVTASLFAAVLTWWLTLTYMPAPADFAPDRVQVDFRTPDTIKGNDIAVFLTDITSEIRDLAEPLVKSGNYLQLKELVKTYQTDYPDNPYLLGLQGHIAMFDKQYDKAMAYYKTALEDYPALSRDELLSKNLVRLLDYERVMANRLIARFLSQPMLAALSTRTGQPGLRGRYDAFYLLKDSGNPDKVDKVGLNIQDLKELDRCALKKVAIEELSRLGDPRALPALEESLGGNIFQQLKYLCYRDEAENAIENIQAKLNQKSSNNP